MAVDMKLSSYMVLPSLIKKGVNEMWNVPLYTKEIAALLSTTNNKNSHVHRRITINVEDKEFQEKFERPDLFDTRTVQLAKEGKLSLDDMLNAYPKAYIRVIVSATDSVTGSKKFFISNNYYRDEIVPGRFKKDAVDIDPDTINLPNTAPKIEMPS